MNDKTISEKMERALSALPTKNARQIMGGIEARARLNDANELMRAALPFVHIENRDGIEQARAMIGAVLNDEEGMADGPDYLDTELCRSVIERLQGIAANLKDAGPDCSPSDMLNGEMMLRKLVEDIARALGETREPTAAPPRHQFAEQVESLCGMAFDIRALDNMPVAICERLAVIADEVREVAGELESMPSEPVQAIVISMKDARCYGPFSDTDEAYTFASYNLGLPDDDFRIAELVPGTAQTIEIEAGRKPIAGG